MLFSMFVHEAVPGISVEVLVPDFGGSAGALIDRAGLKGLQIGGAIVSDKHANFIVAKDGCTSRDVMRLIEAVRQRVREQSDIALEPEIEIWR